MIDYIFSSPQSLERMGFLGGLDPGWIADNKIIGFPHPHVPADHIPIMAQYVLKPHHRRATAPVCTRFRRRSESFTRVITQVNNTPPHS